MDFNIHFSAKGLMGLFVCTDFRKINSVTVPDAFLLLLRIDDCFDSLGAAKYLQNWIS